MARRGLLIASGIATVAFNAVLFVIDTRLEATGGPGILGLEFAGSQGSVDRIVAEWGGHGEYLARLSLWLDFGFMASYGTFFTLAALATRDFARERGRATLAGLGRVAPYLAPGAVLFDVVENVIWLLVLDGGAGFAARVATACAAIKFALIGLAIAYAMAGLVAWLRDRRRPAY